MLRMAAGLGLALAGAAAAAFALGARAPRAHVVARRVRLAQPIEVVWARITDRASEPAWRPGVKRVERQADRDGRPVWREVGGENLVLEEAEVEPPRRLLRRIVGGTRMFGGAWEIVLEPAAPGTLVTVTEHGEVYAPLARFFSRYVLGPTRTVDGYLAALAAGFGERSAIEDAEPAGGSSGAGG